MSGIRVTYSGLVSFGVNLISVITGLVFTLIVTRKLSVEEFGTWGLINGIIIYAMVISPIITYWVSREVARGERTANTAIISTGILSIAGVLIYLVAAFIVGLQSDADLNILLFATILIPILFIEHSLTAINLGHNPQASSYGFLVFEILKILAALLFIYYLKFGLEGAILASCVAYIGKIGIQAFYSKDQLRSKFQKNHLIKWLKLFWVPTYRTLPSLLALSDVVVFSIMTGSVVGVAYYTSARTIGLLVNHVRGLNKGLYPKLLQSEKHEFLQENLIKSLYFAFPLLAFSITFAKPGLFALNPIYQIAAPLVVFIGIRTFLTTLNRMLYDSHLAMEDIDKEGKKASSKDYFKSKLVLIPTLEIVKQGVYVGVLAILLYIYSFQTDSVIDLVLYWVAISLVIEIPITLYMTYLTKKSFKIKIDKNSIFKYLLTSVIVFGIIGLFMEENLEYKNSIFEFLPSLLLYAIISIIGYLVITYLIDNRTRLLIKGIMNEVRK